MQKFSLAIHGGAGTILKSTMTPEKEIAYLDALTISLIAGKKFYHQEGQPLTQ